ncbi:hypothetical protein AM500_19415 [Bacillus sp. FJAT-18017]|uniref:hypothetical protein n=1 Tax=Bacillus sp. FJAT-18017 TaxID=1705566 RepID=UPI0006AF0CD3|nr:hypothetical protein [Bacillus sp. FJAT-18017]ALC92909.1 hypothetical protein AM500_19415 [Bacillus sp. FJAT-18017]
MIQRIVRSPFVPMFIFVILIAFLILSVVSSESGNAIVRFIFLLLVAFTLLWTALIQLHNRRNPNAPVKALGIIPPEFLEMDEGHQWITYKACKNVYIYYSFALPVIAVINFILSGYIVVPLLSIGILGLGQYIVYWLTIRKLNNY